MARRAIRLHSRAPAGDRKERRSLRPGRDQDFPVRVTGALLGQAEAALSELLRFAAPADQVLSQYFRGHRNLGQKDRAFVAETSFAVLRRRRSLEAAAACAEPRALLAAALLRVVGLSARALEGLVEDALLRRVRAARMEEW